MGKKKSLEESSEYKKLMAERARVTKQCVGNPHTPYQERLKYMRGNRAANLGLPFNWNEPYTGK